MNKVIMHDIETIVDDPLPWLRFEGASVLITGGAGFIPAYMAETLLWLNTHVLSTPCEVTVMVRNKARARKRFADYLERSDLEIWEQDVSKSPSVRFNADFVIHAASLASPVQYKLDPIGTILPNVIGTRHLLDAAYASCRGFLYLSSGEAAMNLDPLSPRSCYGESKRMGEAMCVAWANQLNVPAKIARISHTYGPGMKLDDGRVFADFTRDILNGGPIVMQSNGEAKRPFLYLSDAVRALFAVLLNGEVAKAYNVANPDTFVSIAELADRLGREFNIDVQRMERPVGSHSSVYMPSTDSGTEINIEKTQALRWTPVIGIEEGFRRTVASYA